MTALHRSALISAVAVALTCASLSPQSAEAGIRISSHGISITCGDCKKAERATRQELRETERRVNGGLKDFDRDVLHPASESVEEMGQAMLDGTSHLVNDVNQSIDAMGPRFEKGDLFGALYHGQRAFPNRASDTLAQTMTDSSLLRGTVSMGLSTINPYAPALFQTWYVRERTGSGSLALKTGLVSAGTSHLLGRIANTPAGSVNAVEKAGASGAVSGFSHVALGGRYEHGFFQGAVFSGLNSYYRYQTGLAPSAETASRDAVLKPAGFDKSFVLKNRDAAMMGKAFSGLPENPTWVDYLKRDVFSEHNRVFQFLAKNVPEVQGASLLHDLQFHSAPTFAVVSSIPVWFGIHHYAVGGKRESELLKEALRN